MIQRIQTVWLFLVFVIAFLVAYFHFDARNLMVLNGIIAFSSLVAILLYKKRAWQLRICQALIILEAACAVVMYASPTAKIDLAETAGYRWWCLAPVLGIVCVILAREAIKKDEKLVRSLDRLR
jgi:peptidoglycan/LPS O-acetylase OafA/YrhL